MFLLLFDGDTIAWAPNFVKFCVGEFVAWGAWSDSIIFLTIFLLTSRAVSDGSTSGPRSIFFDGGGR